MVGRLYHIATGCGGRVATLVSGRYGCASAYWATIWFSLRRSPTTCWSVISSAMRQGATLGAVSVRSYPALR